MSQNRPIRYCSNCKLRSCKKLETCPRCNTKLKKVKMRKVSGLILFLLLLITPLNSQVVNPTIIEFDHVDFSITDSYEIGYFSSNIATQPVQIGVLPKPSSCTPCSGLLTSKPTAYQTWYVSVRAIAGTQYSVWSTPYVPFVYSVTSPANVRVR